MKSIAFIAAAGLLVAGTALAGGEQFSQFPQVTLPFPPLGKEASWTNKAAYEKDANFGIDLSLSFPGSHFGSLPKNEKVYVIDRMLKQSRYMNTLAEDIAYRIMAKHYNKKADYFGLKRRYSYGKKNHDAYIVLYNQYAARGISLIKDWMACGPELMREGRGYSARFEHDWKMSHGE